MEVEKYCAKVLCKCSALLLSLALVEPDGISVVSLGSGFEVLVGASNVDSACVIALCLVDYQGCPTDVVVATFPDSRWVWSAVAFPGLKVLGYDICIQFGGEVLLENLPQIREPVVGH